MGTEKNTKDDQSSLIRSIAIILSIAVSTFFIMKWISHESKYTGKFLFGFGVSYVGIILFVYFIKYIAELYKQIKSKK